MIKDSEDKLNNLKMMTVNFISVTKEAAKNTMDLDTINAKFSEVKGDVARKPDKDDLDKVKFDCGKYTDRSEGLLKKELEARIKTVKFEHDRLLAEFEMHAENDFKELQAKVTALEKKNSTLTAELKKNSIPKSSDGTGASSLEISKILGLIE
jgi:hypothetical protein